MIDLNSAPWFPGFVTGSLALLGVIFVALLQTVRERRRDIAATKTPEPPTTQQVWERLDRVERVLASSVVLLTEVADQWDGEHPPILSERHLECLADAGYLPPEWESHLSDEYRESRRRK